MVATDNHTMSSASPTRVDQNADSLATEINWFIEVVNHRMAVYFAPQPQTGENGVAGELHAMPGSAPSVQQDSPLRQPPDISNDHSVYADFVRFYQLHPEERILLMLALLPHLQPQLLDVFFTVNKNIGRGYAEFGGIRGVRHGGFIPTIETALFILAGADLRQRFRLYPLFEPDHIFFAHGVLQTERSNQAGEPFYSSVLSIADEYIDFFTTGIQRKPSFSMEFPAKRLISTMEWSDLVVDEITMQQLDDIRTWLEHGRTLLRDWGMAKIIKPGFKALFHGPPGTGKTLTAGLLGKLYNIDVYRIDLSMVISKYIGETEKNLEKVFQKAENKNWILFFDEADALFGKRTGISDAHDKYANQEIAYLLQRLEDYPGLVILASNMRNNVDEAFTRRLQSIIHFQKPQPRERFRLWDNGFSAQCVKPPQEVLERLAQQFDLAGGSIINVIQYASLQALRRGETTILAEDLLKGVRAELGKEGKTI
jgi:AAA+ superfamily predicted ATPase